MATIYEFISTEVERYQKNGESPSDHADEIVERVISEFGTSCTHEHIGGFDSPGYDIDCYAFAFVDEDGKAGIYGYEEESY